MDDLSSRSDQIVGESDSERGSAVVDRSTTGMNAVYVLWKSRKSEEKVSCQAMGEFND